MCSRLPLLFVLSLGALAPACDDDPRGGGSLGAFVAALPTMETLALEVPGEGDLALTDAPLDIIEAPLLGEPSELKALTGGVRRLLVQLIGNALESVERMTDERPVMRTRERVVWRRMLPDRSNERSLIMHKEGGHFSISSWLRPLGPAGNPVGPWHFLMAGRITPGRNGDSRGALWVNLANDRKPRSQGKMSVLWSKLGDTRALEILIFDATPDDGEVGRLTRAFHYNEGPDGGLLAFDAGEIDVHQRPDRPLRERVRVLTRWNAAGAFRSDYSAVGPEVRLDDFRVLLGGECWQRGDGNVTYEARLGIPLDGGDPVRLFERGERATCAFAEEEAPIIAPPGDAPVEPPRPDNGELPDS